MECLLSVMNENQANQFFEQAVGLLQAGKLVEAERILKRIDHALPSQPSIIYYLAIAASLQGKKESAINLYSRVIQLYPQFVEAYNNRGLDLNALGRCQEAADSFHMAIQIRPDFVEAHSNLGVVLNELGSYEEALASFLAVLQMLPNHVDALVNVSTSLLHMKRYAEAEQVLLKAVSVNPEDVTAITNMGNLYALLKRWDEAAMAYQKALELEPNRSDALSGLGTLCAETKQWDAAISLCTKALQLKPDTKWLAGTLLHSRMQVCDWQGFDASVSCVFSNLELGRKALMPFPNLGLASSIAQQKQCAEIYTRSELAPCARPRLRYEHCKIRVGYMSCDFKRHPISYLMTGVIELHDRERFEIHGIDIGRDDRSDERQRLLQAFDRMHDVSAMSDPEIAELIRELEIDVLIDLTGLTSGARTNILASHPAPVQINYLGFPGTMGAPFIDYIIGDPILIPPEAQVGYSEKIAYLPECFQANDSQRAIGQVRDRASFGLAASAFVFGCFNQCFKITPQIFSVWLSVLKQVPGSVLWLIEESETQANNLRSYAAAQGFSVDRLIFTGKLPYAEHLARYALMDLALDTLPFNGGTTTSDALWGGAPVLTCIGETFAGRMAASLLNTVGLPELVTQSLESYEALAVALATNPGKLDTIRQTLAANRLTMPLFDTQRFTRHLENAYEQMMDRSRQGLPPDHIYASLNRHLF